MTTSTAPRARITPGGFRQLGPLNWFVCRLLSRGANVQDAHVFSTLGRARGIFRGWLYLSSTMMPFGRLTRYETEMVILRVAHLRECAYELDHHVRLGRRAGITQSDLQRIFTAPESIDWPPRHRAMLTAVDELVAAGDMSDSAWGDLAGHCTARELIEFVMLVGHYSALATTLTALRVERDTPRSREKD